MTVSQNLDANKTRYESNPSWKALTEISTNVYPNVFFMKIHTEKQTNTHIDILNEKDVVNN